MNHNGTKAVWKEAWSRGPSPDAGEMGGLTPLMLAIQFLDGYDSYAMKMELLMNAIDTGKNNPPFFIKVLKMLLKI